jgi:hypothetical protein
MNENDLSNEDLQKIRKHLELLGFKVSHMEVGGRAEVKLYVKDVWVSFKTNRIPGIMITCPDEGSFLEMESMNVNLTTALLTIAEMRGLGLC